MSFAAPLFLIAALAAAIPMLIHLIHKRTAREVPFPTLRFLKLSVERTRRRRYIEEMGLLLLRMAALALIALGLARPAILGWNRIWNRGPSTTALIILDNSGSMAAAEVGVSRFDRARAAALAVLDHIQDGDLVALELTCGPPGPEQGRFYARHDTIRQAVMQARVWPQKADLATTVRAGRQRLEAQGVSNRELFVISDQQAISWEGIDAGMPSDSRTAARPIPVILLPISGDIEPNVALGRLRVEAPAPIPGVPVQVSVEVFNPTDVPQQKHVELLIDGRREELSPDLILAPGARVTQVFRFTQENAGVHRGEVRLVEPDGNPLDNQVAFVHVTDQKIRVAVVHGGSAATPVDRPSYYLERALEPGESGGAVELTVLPADRLPSMTWNDHRVTYLVDVPSVPDEVISRLGEHVQGGGHVIWICGPRTEHEAYARMATQAPAGLLPALPGPTRQRTESGRDAWNLSSLDEQFPAFTPLIDPPALYQSILITHVRGLDLKPEMGGRVLATLDDGSPIWIMRSVGAGSAHIIGTAWHTEWSNWPLRPIFLPMVMRMTYHLAGAQAQGGELTAGSPLQIPVDSKQGAPIDLEVMRPNGEMIRLREQTPVEGFVRYDDTHDPGVYLVRGVKQANSRTIGYGINADPRESEASLASLDEIEKKLAPAPVLRVAAIEDLPRSLRDLREGQSLRDGLLIGVLLALIAEAAVANRKRVVPISAEAANQGADAPTSGPHEQERGEALDMSAVLAGVAAQNERGGRGRAR